MCIRDRLSGGQRQKIYLAMALAQQTKTIFMDEPTTWLDVRHQMEVMRTAKDLAAAGKAVVLVSHDLCLALRTADPVSYTHLDVYKRQLCGRSFPRHWGSRLNGFCAEMALRT